MPAFCIPTNIAAKISASFKSGELSVEKLYKMTSEQRNKAFAPFAGQSMAKEINTGFEKAMLSNQQSVFKKWAQATLVGKDKEVRLNNVIEKVNKLSESGLLTPKTEEGFMRDLVEDKLGVSVTPEEAKGIAERSERLTEAQKHVGGSLGDPTVDPKAQETYLKAREDMSNYLASLNPASNIKVALGTIGRGMMVFNLHSPVLNVVSHSVITLPEMITRRIETRTVHGLNGNFWGAYVKNTDHLFSKTGYDLSRFEALGGERKSMGEDYTHSQGSGIIRWTGRLVEKTVFAHLHGDLYEKFASRHFADSANLQTTAVARLEGLTGDAAKIRALELSKDAALVEPKTELGRAIRAKAQADALYSTFTNKSVVSETALGIRTLANKATGEFRLGDILIPFAKVPANALGAALEYAGVNASAKLVLGLGKTFAGILGRQPFDPANFAGMQRSFIRAGLGLTFSYAISELIKPEDFIGAFPTNPSEQKLQSERNGVNNAIKVGNRWVSLDYLGNDASAILGFLYAKKYGNNTPLDYIYRYSEGQSSIMQNIPGLSQIAAVYKYLNTPPSQKTDSGTFVASQAKGALSQLTARIIPGFVADIAKMTDPYNRAVDSTSITDSVQSNIPGLREGLPIKNNLFGKPTKTEPYLSTLLFGSRIKSVQDSQLLTALVRLDQQGAIPSITDVSKSSKAMGELKTQIGDQKFSEAMHYFGKTLKQNWTDTISSDDYKNADSADAQKALLDKAKTATLKDTLDTYGYEKPVKP